MLCPPPSARSRNIVSRPAMQGPRGYRAKPFRQNADPQNLRHLPRVALPRRFSNRPALTFQKIAATADACPSRHCVQSGLDKQIATDRMTH